MVKSKPQERFVRVRDINLRYVDWGDNGPTLLLLHGSMRTSRSWDAMARLLHDRFHVIALDARGHGNSDWTQRGYGYSNLTEDLKGFCDELNLKSMIAVGHSLGGEVLTLLAEQCPALFDCLVLLEPRVLIDRPEDRTEPQRPHRRRTWSSREDLHGFLKQHRTAGRWRDDVILDVVNHETMELPDGRIDIKWSPDSMNHDESHREHADLKPVFRALNMPILFVVSELRVSNFRDLPPLASETPNFHLTTVKNTDHNMYMERPDAVASVISDFVNDRALPEII